MITLLFGPLAAAMFAAPVLEMDTRLSHLDLPFAGAWSSDGFGLHIDYAFHGHDDKLGPSTVRDFTGEVERAVERYARDQGARLADCQATLWSEQLDIYYIPYDVLNDRSIFEEFTNVGPKDEVIGLFDPVLDRSEYTLIALAWPRSQKPLEVLVHELAHYWYYRLCWEHWWKDDPEAFANSFSDWFLETRPFL